MKVLLSPSNNPSVVDKFTLFSYDFSHPCQISGCAGAQWTSLTGITTVLPANGSVAAILAGTGGTGLISDAQMTYAVPGSGQATSNKNWDYYSGTYPTSLPDAPPGSPKQEVDQTWVQRESRTLSNRQYYKRLNWNDRIGGPEYI